MREATQECSSLRGSSRGYAVPRRTLQFRVPQSCWRTIDAGVRTTTLQHEPVLFALTSGAVAGDRNLILVREVIVPPESVFVKTRSHGAQWTAKYNLELLNRCLNGRYGLLILHR